MLLHTEEAGHDMEVFHSKKNRENLCISCIDSIQTEWTLIRVELAYPEKLPGPQQ